MHHEGGGTRGLGQPSSAEHFLCGSVQVPSPSELSFPLGYEKGRRMSPEAPLPLAAGLGVGAGLGPPCPPWAFQGCLTFASRTSSP